MTELEAKFLIRRPEQFDQVLIALVELGYRVAECATQTLLDHYFDTPDWAILRSGWVYRRRERDGRQMLTLKSLGSKHGDVFTREEIDQPLVDRSVSPTGDIPPGSVQEQLVVIAGNTAVRELFHVQTRRTVFAITPADDDKTRIELDLDRTEIHATKIDEDAPGRLDFTELEFEVEPGDADPSTSLLEQLGDGFGLIPAQLSKFERGIQAAGLPVVQEENWQSIPWPGGEDPAPELLHRYVLRQVGQMKLHAPRAWEGLEPEGVHKMRVAVRRARSVMRAFRHMVPEQVWDPLNSEQRWLARRLGRARDADIFNEAIWCHDDVLDGAAAIDIEPFVAQIKTSSDSAYASVGQALASERYTKLIEDLERFAISGPNDAIRDEFGELQIADYADQLVNRALNEVLSQGRCIAEDSTARQLHKLRIAAKRLRYLLDCFVRAGLTQWLGLIDATRELQDLLGAHQDAVMVRDRLTTYAKSSDPAMNRPGLLRVINKLIEREDDRAIGCRHRFPEYWARFESNIP